MLRQSVTQTFKKQLIQSKRRLFYSQKGLFGFTGIETSETGVVTRFGRVNRTLKPGLNLYVPYLEKVYGVTNRVLEDHFKFNVKTEDDVFTVLDIAVQSRIQPDDSVRAMFELNDARNQMRSYIENVIRSEASRKQLNQIYSEQDELSSHIMETLADGMKRYGFTIVKTLIRNINPDESVRNAMNSIYASEREKEATKNRAEARYIKDVRQAEADAERKRLQGEGISAQRLAILAGYEKGVEEMSQALKLSPKDIIQFVMKTQELDTWESIGRSQNSKTLFLNPTGGTLRNEVISANEVHNL